MDFCIEQIHVLHTEVKEEDEEWNDGTETKNKKSTTS